MEKNELKRVKMNLLLHGVPGLKENCLNTAEKVLSRAFPQLVEGNGLGLLEAFRLCRFQPSAPRPRPILLTFCSWETIIAILGDKEGKGLLEEKGIRILQDKTER